MAAVNMSQSSKAAVAVGEDGLAKFVRDAEEEAAASADPKAPKRQEQEQMQDERRPAMPLHLQTLGVAMLQMAEDCGLVQSPAAGVPLVRVSSNKRSLIITRLSQEEVAHSKARKAQVHKPDQPKIGQPSYQ